ncbi:DeoR/GlpR family DNA-binding transcription regulator [Streptomyces sp. NBC_00006]|uniref:DeoR/GlpR family DNA-binding transcription regulator n=1 Tax=Streptomyces sp. NBC_00006 TaxID=2975619 RepID=UPI00224CA381|nr:DeoR/GlpR family DNA-binding transcription regulator [Streptomyces sp. NBC_00006]MCX5529620.1 DeoR/GlpR family DNA-binding transcription regulator [Streptomyces sp. NBC_00006]
MDSNTGEASDTRRAAIITALREGVRRVDELADCCGVSPMTIRRDLQFLEEQGAVRRIRGGAVPVDTWTFEHRLGRGAEAKRRIAEKLLPLVPDQGGIGLDGSSTAHHLTLALQSRTPRDLTAVTTGLETFHRLSRIPGVRAYSTGGSSDVDTGSLVGPLAQLTLQQFALETCFLSATYLDPTLGSTEFTAEEATVKRAMVAVSKRTVLAVDSTKLNRHAVAKCLGLDEVDLLVTELAPDDATLTPYRELVEIL